MIEVKYECPSCSGSGLYSGFMERTDEAVVCVSCGGKGYRVEKFRAFTGRRKRRGIKKIRFGSGMILDNPSKSTWFSYEEFEKKIPSEK